MGVIVNGRFLSRQATGVDRFAKEVLRRLEGRVSVRGRDSHRSGAAGHLWEQTALAVSLGREDVLWSPANTGPVLVENQVLTIHDLSPLDHPEWFTARFALWYYLLWHLLIPRVRKILVPSEFVRGRVIARFRAEALTVIPEGVDPEVFRPGTRARRLDVPERYVLYVGSIQPRKNLTELLAAWRCIQNEYPDTWLVIAGRRGANFRDVSTAVDLARVLFTGYVPEEELPGLYAGAMLLVLPSLEEGFGLPILEAMACGTPVLASDGGALPETTGKAGMIFRLSDPWGLTNALRTLLSDTDLRLTLRQAGLERASRHSWEMTAERVWSEIRAL